MGDIKRKRQGYSRPRQLFDRERIDEENVIVRKFGLKNKKEIWKVKALVSKFRRRAKDLISADAETQREFFEKLQKLGLNITNISDVLALTESDLLERRLQTFVLKKGLSNSPKQSRQLIVHKHIIVDDKIVNIPSFWITKELENKIDVKPRKEKPAAPEKETETTKEEEE